jgi:antitoxin component of MazEF toxin-antitoxin module
MPRRVRVQNLPNGQYVVTIPKALAETIGLRRGEEVQWSLRGDELVLRRMSKTR